MIAGQIRSDSAEPVCRHSRVMDMDAGSGHVGEKWVALAAIQGVQETIH